MPFRLLLNYILGFMKFRTVRNLCIIKAFTLLAFCGPKTKLDQCIYAVEKNRVEEVESCMGFQDDDFHLAFRKKGVLLLAAQEGHHESLKLLLGRYPVNDIKVPDELWRRYGFSSWGLKQSILSMNSKGTKSKRKGAIFDERTLRILVNKIEKEWRGLPESGTGHCLRIESTTFKKTHGKKLYLPDGKIGYAETKYIIAPKLINYCPFALKNIKIQIQFRNPSNEKMIRIRRSFNNTIASLSQTKVSLNEPRVKSYLSQDETLGYLSQIKLSSDEKRIKSYLPDDKKTKPLRDLKAVILAYTPVKSEMYKLHKATYHRELEMHGHKNRAALK